MPCMEQEAARTSATRYQLLPNSCTIAHSSRSSSDVHGIVWPPTAVPLARRPICVIALARSAFLNEGRGIMRFRTPNPYFGRVWVGVWVGEWVQGSGQGLGCMSPI